MRTPIDQLKREALAADWQTSIEPKWTLRNDEWVKVAYEITRGPNGLSDRPVNAKPGATK